MAHKEYSNGEVTVVWKSDLCIHSQNCFKGLPSVFDPQKRPWVNVEGANSKQIIDQVKKCPSGALAYYMNNKEKQKEDQKIQDEQIVEVTPNGPLMVYGNVKVKFPDGRQESKHRVTAFCRCGSSANKPFCDGSHKRVDFKG